MAAALTAARRPRDLATALVTAGGGDAGRDVAREAAEQLLVLAPSIEIFVAAPGDPIVEHERVTWAMTRGGLAERIRWADVAVSAAGSTPYDLACAGVPMALRAFADNQRPILRAFLDAGLAVADVAGLGDATARDAIAAIGPRHVDGYGAFRARDAPAGRVRGPAGTERAALPTRDDARRRTAAGMAQRPAGTRHVVQLGPHRPRAAPCVAQRRARGPGPHAARRRARRRRGGHAAVRPPRRPCGDEHRGRAGGSRARPRGADDRGGDGAAARRVPAAHGRSRRGPSA